MFTLRVSQLKLVRTFPYGSLSLGPPKWSNNEKKVNELTWMSKVEHMSGGAKKGGDLFRDMDSKMLIQSIGCAYKEIPWSESSKAPNPIFWSSIAAAGGFWIPPMTCCIFGYCNWLSYCEITWAAISCAYSGGIRYGMTVEKILDPSWYNLSVSALPPFIGFLSLTFLPQLIAYPVVLATMIISSLHDILNPKLSIWYRSLRLLAITSSSIAMILMFLIKILNLGK